MIFFLFVFITRIQMIACTFNCVYEVDEGLKLDLRTLAHDHGQGPKFDQILNVDHSHQTLSWNPCFSYSKVDNGNCTNAAACYTDSISNTSVILAKQTACRFEYYQGLSIISYEYSNFRLKVFLICHNDEHENSAIAFQDDSRTYNIYLQSRCCCPGMCYYSTHAISSILIMIMIIIILLFGYTLGSIIFLRRSLNLAASCRYLCFDYLGRAQTRNVNSDYQDF